jgi:two-component system sensor histidine kinase GlrK
MKKPHSPTLLSLILLGFILVALPLIASIITAIAQVDRLARDSRTDMLAVQEDTVASRALVERATLMERSARQFQALRDDVFIGLYTEHRDEALALLDRLAADHRSPELMAAVTETRNTESRIRTLIANIDDPATRAQLETALTRLRDNVLAVIQAQNAISREMAAALPERARRLQRTLMGQAMLVIPVSAGLAVVFFFVIAPPLRQIGRSIRELGRGALREPIQIKGPRDLEQLGQRLEWLRNRLVELEAQKSQFLRNVSHELKTPLTNIREGAELLTEDHAPEARGEVLQVARIVQENSIRLQQMIETLLRYGADGDLTASQARQAVQFDQIVLETIERQAMTAAGRSVSIKPTLEPAPLFGSPKCLQVIVENLLSNALKYAPHGGLIEIRLMAEPQEVKLEIRDYGPGISERDREHIFEWFYTGPRPPGSIVAGTGMGLAIAQEYAEQHGGRIVLLPSTEGALFQLTLGTNNRE